MRIPTQAMSHAGATSSASVAQAGAATDILFAALLASATAASEPPDLMAALPEPISTTARSPDAAVAETAAVDADIDGAAIADPVLLALLSPAQTRGPARETMKADAGNQAASIDALPPSSSGTAPEASASLPTEAQASHRPVLASSGSKAQITSEVSTPTPAALAAQVDIEPASVAHEPATHTDLPGGFAMATAAYPALSAADPSFKSASLHLPAPLSSERWGHAFSEQVLWMAHKDVQTASLTINPPELGPVKIELQLNDSQAVASFSSVQPEVRKAIEDALPALKTLFAEAGLDLRQADVGNGNAHERHSQHSRPSESGHFRSSVGSGPASAELPVNMTSGSHGRLSRGLLDTFA